VANTAVVKELLAAGADVKKAINASSYSMCIFLCTKLGCLPADPEFGFCARGRGTSEQHTHGSPYAAQHLTVPMHNCAPHFKEGGSCTKLSSWGSTCRTGMLPHANLRAGSCPSLKHAHSQQCRCVLLKALTTAVALSQKGRAVAVPVASGFAGRPQAATRPGAAQQQALSAYRPIVHVVGAAGEGSAMAMRVRAAEALGRLCAHVSGKVRARACVSCVGGEGGVSSVR